MDTVHVAIVGTGGVSTMHANAWRHAPRVTLVGAIDINLDVAREKADAWGVPAYESIDHAVKETGIDLLDVCTPEHLHAAVCTAAIGKAPAIVSEKIMAHDLSSGRAMAEASSRAEREGVRLFNAVQYNYRWLPAIRALKHTVESGEILERVEIVTHRFCFHHILDAVRYIAGDPNVVSAVGAPRDWDADLTQTFRISRELIYIPSDGSTFTLTYNSGLVFAITASATIELSNMPFQITGLFQSGLTYTATGMSWSGNMIGRLFLGAEELDVQSYVPAFVPREWVGPEISFLGNLADIARRFLNGEAAPVSWREGYRLMLLDHALQRSIETNEPVALRSVSEGMTTDEEDVRD